MTIESQYLNVIYCKMTKAGTRTSVSALVLQDVRFGAGQGPQHVARPGGDR